MTATGELPILSFASAALWEQWLSAHHAQPTGLWIKIAKKASGFASVTYDEAIDVALCYGWIDGQRKTYDSDFFQQKFTPRRARSLWSKRNINKVADLIAAGRMQPSGLAEIETAQQDGRWDTAYDSPKDMAVPEDLLQALRENKAAGDFFATLNRTNVYAITWRLATARTPETRQRRLNALIAKLEKKELP